MVMEVVGVVAVIVLAAALVLAIFEPGFVLGGALLALFAGPVYPVAYYLARAFGAGESVSVAIGASLSGSVFAGLLLDSWLKRPRPDAPKEPAPDPTVVERTPGKWERYWSGD